MGRIATNACLRVAGEGGVAGGAGGPDRQAGHRRGGSLHRQALRQGQEGQVVHSQPGNWSLPRTTH